MKEKLVEQWLINAGERGGIDQAFAQWLVSQNHEIIWLGHSATEFGKDIISRASDNSINVYQLKDEDINLEQLRNIHPQLVELVEMPPIHPNLKPGCKAVPHLVTSGNFNEVATQKVRALNEGWKARGLPELKIVGRRELTRRFIEMSDSFWPETPKNIRDFFSFYLASGKGDFNAKKFGSVLEGLLNIKGERKTRMNQRLAAVGLLGNYLLNPFDREKDHWSLIQGWTMIGAYQAWYASKTQLPPKNWKSSFELSKKYAIFHIDLLAKEALQSRAFFPEDFEIDDYTRARNLILAGGLALAGLLKTKSANENKQEINDRLKKLLRNDRLFCWGEGSMSLILIIQWYLEKNQSETSFLLKIQAAISELCERNHLHAEDEPFYPPSFSPDEVLVRLFHESTDMEPLSRGSWTLEALLHFFARRNLRSFLEDNWRKISKIEMIYFQPSEPIDMLLWECKAGHESSRYPQATQSWKKLREDALLDRSQELPSVLKEDIEFFLLFIFSYSHRINISTVCFLDKFVNI